MEENIYKIIQLVNPEEDCGASYYNKEDDTLFYASFVCLALCEVTNLKTGKVEQSVLGMDLNEEEIIIANGFENFVEYIKRSTYEEFGDRYDSMLEKARLLYKKSNNNEEQENEI